jgi:uncharacterized membrane protein YeaQ/YmgE (transglycosylase-associated protein family)
MTMDNKISFIAGWFLTTATTITAMGLFKAALIGLVGGFFGLFGKEVYYHTRKKTVQYAPIAKAWVADKVAWIKSKF